VHWGAIESAYNNSPFFEYYKDDLLPLFDKKQQFLWDFNLCLMEKVFELLQIERPKIQLTTHYQQHYLDEDIEDCRGLFHPKQAHSKQQSSYYQVFAEKFGFVPDLSIIDLLFNMGNEATIKLKIKK
jgi:hypothetical protein